MLAKGLHIGFVVPAFDMGGLEEVVVDLYRAATVRGIRATILVENGEPGRLASQVLPDDLVFLRGQRTAFFGALMGRRITALHYNYSVLDIAAATALGIRTVYVLHNSYTWLTDSEFAGRSVDIAAADAIIAVSSYCRDYFLQRANFHDVPVRVVPNGVTTVRSEAIRKGVSSPYVFALVGRFDRIKQHAALIGAAERLVERGQRLKVLLIGGAGEPEYETEIRNLLAASPAGACFEWVGALSRDGVREAMAARIDCVVATSIQEGCSLVPIEAAAAGCRVITTNTGAARELAEIAPDQVEVVPAAAIPLELTSKVIAALSMTKTPPNVDAIADAMARAMRHGDRPVPLDLDITPFSSRAMIDAHMQIIDNLVKTEA